MNHVANEKKSLSDKAVFRHLDLVYNAPFAKSVYVHAKDVNDTDKKFNAVNKHQGSSEQLVFQQEILGKVNIGQT